MKTVSIISFIVLCMITNYVFLENYIIPDQCRYHKEEMSFLINVFYNTPSINNGHPIPSLMNHVFTIGIGSLLGSFFYEFIKKVFLEDQRLEEIRR